MQTPMKYIVLSFSSWLNNHLPDLTFAELGFELISRGDIKPEIDMETEDIPDVSNVGTQPLSKFEAIPDDMSPEDILVQCQVRNLYSFFFFSFCTISKFG